MSTENQVKPSLTSDLLPGQNRYSAIAILKDDSRHTMSSNDLTNLNKFVIEGAKEENDIVEIRIVRNVQVMHVPAGAIIWRHINRKLANPFPVGLSDATGGHG